MKTSRRSGLNQTVKAKIEPTAEPQEEHPLEHAQIDAGRSGDWMPAQELKVAVLAALESNCGVTINLDRIDHLDASAMQILLALDLEQKRRGKDLQLINASANLQRWFEYSGSASHFSGDAGQL
jgi:anti-anti-sigma regulatory factor